jgi:hypothetical protein
MKASMLTTTKRNIVLSFTAITLMTVAAPATANANDSATTNFVPQTAIYTTVKKGAEIPELNQQEELPKRDYHWLTIFDVDHTDWLSDCGPYFLFTIIGLGAILASLIKRRAAPLWATILFYVISSGVALTPLVSWNSYKSLQTEYTSGKCEQFVGRISSMHETKIPDGDQITFNVHGQILTYDRRLFNSPGYHGAGSGSLGGGFHDGAIVKVWYSKRWSAIARLDVL